MASFTGGMGVSFQAENHLPGGCKTAPKCNIIMVAAPQPKAVSMMDLPCARPPRPSASPARLEGGPEPLS